MSEGTTTVAGLTIPSTDPVFLSIVGVHIVIGIVAVVSGFLAMLAVKAPGRHPRFGKLYFWSLTAIFVSVVALSAMSWERNVHLFILGALSFVAAIVGRQARRHRWRTWANVHIVGMGASYVLLLTAFYVDNGKQLPLWKALPTWTYWTLPAAVGLPIIIWALLRHPLVVQQRRR